MFKLSWAIFLICSLSAYSSDCLPKFLKLTSEARQIIHGHLKSRNIPTNNLSPQENSNNLRSTLENFLEGEVTDKMYRDFISKELKDESWMFSGRLRDPNAIKWLQNKLTELGYPKENISPDDHQKEIIQTISNLTNVEVTRRIFNPLIKEIYPQDYHRFFLPLDENSKQKLKKLLLEAKLPNDNDFISNRAQAEEILENFLGYKLGLKRFHTLIEDFFGDEKYKFHTGNFQFNIASDVKQRLTQAGIPSDRDMLSNFEKAKTIITEMLGKEITDEYIQTYLKDLYPRNYFMFYRRPMGEDYYTFLRERVKQFGLPSKDNILHNHVDIKQKLELFIGKFNDNETAYKLIKTIFPNQEELIIFNPTHEKRIAVLRDLMVSKGHPNLTNLRGQRKRLWNDLELALRDTISVDTFRNIVKNIFPDDYQYYFSVLNKDDVSQMLVDPLKERGHPQYTNLKESRQKLKKDVEDILGNSVTDAYFHEIVQSLYPKYYGLFNLRINSKQLAQYLNDALLNTDFFDNPNLNYKKQVLKQTLESIVGKQVTDIYFLKILKIMWPNSYGLYLDINQIDKSLLAKLLRDSLKDLGIPKLADFESQKKSISEKLRQIMGVNFERKFELSVIKLAYPKHYKLFMSQSDYSDYIDQIRDSILSKGVPTESAFKNYHILRKFLEDMLGYKLSHIGVHYHAKKIFPKKHYIFHYHVRLKHVQEDLRIIYLQSEEELFSLNSQDAYELLKGKISALYGRSVSDYIMIKLIYIMDWDLNLFEHLSKRAISVVTRFMYTPASIEDLDSGSSLHNLDELIGDSRIIAEIYDILSENGLKDFDLSSVIKTLSKKYSIDEIHEAIDEFKKHYYDDYN